MDSYIQLEFDKIKKLLAGLCHSRSAKRLALAARPLQQSGLITDRQRIVGELQEIIRRGHDNNFQNITDITPLFDNYDHLTYSFLEFRQIYHIVNKAEELVDEVGEYEEEFSDSPAYLEMVDKLIPIPEILKRYRTIFSDEGEILDTASPELQSIRKRQSRLRQNVLNLLEKKIQDKSFDNIIQDKIITLRDDRYVIPLKEGTIGSMPGIVHGYSGSKATIFVEPNEAIGLNNDIHHLREEEKEEIFRILERFTRTVQEHREEIKGNYLLLTDLDFLFAIARLGNSFQGNIPKISTRMTIKLEEARHPLLIHALKDRDKVVPFDLQLGEDYKILILSGPNTGGKTVTLKTIGLLTLMALSGFPVPASENSEFGLFQHILADIGDQQSLEDSLSTFSAHLNHIRHMLEIGNDRTLILIDEIGAATDPEQGAALAQSILEELIARKVIGVVTTHYTPLKLYAMESELCRNAAMQFDPDKHIPTYRFMLGLPGNSFALEIAEKLGLQENLLDRARELAGKQNVELTDLLSRISNEKKELAQNRFQYELKLRLLEMKISEYEEKLANIERDRKTIRQETIREARDYLTTLQRELTDELTRLKEQEKEEKKLASRKILRKISGLSNKLLQEEHELISDTLTPVSEPKTGETVWVRNLGGTGEIVSIEKNGVRVDFNGILYLTDTDNLFYRDKARPEKKKPVKPVIPGSSKAKTELKVLGLTFDEALPLIESFIDEGYAAGLNKLRIVHGKGTGALRDKIRSYLKGSHRINDFYSPAPEAGGDGVTVVVIN